MDEQTEAFLTDVMAFEREDSNAIRGGRAPTSRVL